MIKSNEIGMITPPSDPPNEPIWKLVGDFYRCYDTLDVLTELRAERAKRIRQSFLQARRQFAASSRQKQKQIEGENICGFAKEIRKENPDITQKELALLIQGKFTLYLDYWPGTRRIKSYLREMERDGTLPRRQTEKQRLRADR